MINLLVSGTLIKAPDRRTSQNGNPYVLAQVADPGDGGLVSVVAFDDQVREALAALSKGDAVIVSGPGKPTTWTSNRDGSQQLGLNVVAKVVMTHYSASKKRKAAGDISAHVTERSTQQYGCSESGRWVDYSQTDVEYV